MPTIAAHLPWQWNIIKYIFILYKYAYTTRYNTRSNRSNGRVRLSSVRGFLFVYFLFPVSLIRIPWVTPRFPSGGPRSSDVRVKHGARSRTHTQTVHNILLCYVHTRLWSVVFYTHTRVWQNWWARIFLWIIIIRTTRRCSMRGSRWMSIADG